LVVSFLYPRGYYQDIFRELVEQKSVSWHGTGRGSPRNTGDYDKCFVDVLDFYPGFIDAESVLNKIRRKLDSARLEGRPFTAVVVDGIHNVILQYPLLERERMLWPVLYRLFRSEGLNSVSTFTFFEMWRADGNSEEKLVQIRAGASHNWTDSNTVSVSEEIFYHLLISSSDYTFVVEREAAEERRTNLMKIRVGASIDGFHGRPQSFRWDPRRFRAVIPRNSTGE